MASLTYYAADKKLPSESSKHAVYFLQNLVSFCRSHFIISDLMLGGEIIEAVVIMRKQIELLSRLQELVSGQELERLNKKTPNVAYLKTPLKTTYGDHSEISHSATARIFELLGSISTHDGVYIALYPVFQGNVYVVFQNLILSLLEMYPLMRTFLCENFSYQSVKDEQLYKNIQKLQKIVFSDLPLPRK